MTYTFGKRKYEFGKRTFVMGILNITPDSFSDGGKYMKENVLMDKVLQDASRMESEGADFIDVGGESTRPGSAPVSPEEEISRVVPVIEELVKHLNIPVSVDTYKGEVADRALEAGAVIVNDISGFRYDKSMPEVAAKHNASCILMHIKGTPRDMQNDPQYEDVVGEVCEYLSESAAIASDAGIEQIIIDPGIGFGKNLEHNLELIRNLNVLRTLGFPVLVGLSRKSFIDKISSAPVTGRLSGTISANTLAVNNGADILRVHDVNENLMAARIADKITR